MAIEINGATYETDEEGYLINLAEWNEDVANVIAKTENVDMTPSHWEVVTFLRDYYNVGLLGGDRASDDVVRASWNLAALASARALSDCVPAWLTDFRADLPHVDVPALVVHGDDDWVLPIVATGLRLHQSLAGSRWVVIEGGAHGLLWTHAEEVNRALLAFLEAHMRGAVR